MAVLEFQRPVHGRLKKLIDYVANIDKTSPEKNGYEGERRMYATALNCLDIETAYEEMMATKKRYGKVDKIQAFHMIQSFKPGEVTPELAHEIGLKLAEQLSGGDFEVVVGTHLDKGHIHNHIVINSVSCMDGKKFSLPNLWKARHMSDALCREHGLSVIENAQGKGKHYAAWEAEKKGKDTVFSAVRQDIDDIIKHSYSYSTFLEQLKKRGYSVRHGPNIKYTSITPPGYDKPIRLTEKSLGKNYTEEAIKRRLLEQQREVVRKRRRKSIPQRWLPHRCKRPFKRKKRRSIRALYLKYLYMLGKAKRHRARPKMNSYLALEVRKLERYTKQYSYMHKSGVLTLADLQQKQDALEKEINRLTEQRRELYRERKECRETQNEEKEAEITEQIETLNQTLRPLRQETKICQNIRKDCETVRQKKKEAQAFTKSKPKPKEKEAKKREHGIRGRRPYDPAGAQSNRRSH